MQLGHYVTIFKLYMSAVVTGDSSVTTRLDSMGSARAVVCVTGGGGLLADVAVTGDGGGFA